jgi:hypothetical protein
MLSGLGGGVSGVLSGASSLPGLRSSLNSGRWLIATNSDWGGNWNGTWSMAPPFAASPAFGSALFQW